MRPLRWLLLLAACAHADQKPSQPASSAASGGAVAQALAAGLRDAGADPTAERTCAACHDTIAAEFEGAMHQRAHQSRDPVFGTMLTARMRREGPGLASACASCHAPQDVAAPDSPTAAAGVTCVTCHRLDAVALDGGHGAQALRPATGLTMRAGFDVAAGASPFHDTGPGLPALADGQTLCLACHAEDRNRAGVPTCSTGVELATGGERRTCADCHLPVVQGPSGVAIARPTHRSHAFAGPHRAWAGDVTALAAGVEVSGRFESPTRFVASVHNASGHGFPSGFPARMALVVLRGLDATGAEVWRNVKAEPMKEHPEAVLNKVYLDADGGQTLAPWATSLARDGRLRPDETRALAVTVPPEVVTMETTVRFWLVGPFAAKALGLSGPEASPVDVKTVRISR